MTDKLARAYSWLNWGASLVPIQPRSKFIVAGYGARSKRITAEQEAFYWFEERSANIGLVLGGGFVCADFDDWDVYFRWAETAGVLLASYAEKSERGAHVIYRAREELPGGRADGVEFKSSGVVMVAPSTNANGYRYRILCDLPPASIDKHRAGVLFSFLHKAPPLPTRPQSAPYRPASNSIVGQIKAKLRLDEVVCRAGVELRHGGPGELVGLCPFDHDGRRDSRPSLWVNVNRQLWGCYSPSCESNKTGERAHDVINFVALVRHVPVSRAILDLAAEVAR